jgi:preprotein translocase subunit YajC
MHLISPAYAQSLPGGMSMSSLTQFAPLILIFGVFYFILIRPQQQKQKALKASLSAIKRGDRVVTAGGILGVVQKTRDGSNEVEVEIAPNVRVVVLRETISNIVKPVVANDAKPTTTPAKVS